MSKFKLVSDFAPQGDQDQAIDALSEGIESGEKYQTLLGITGSGKTFTMANVIERVQRPTLVFSHNKTLASQLYQEFKEFFPDNAIEYFVSYYDYYQPEAYVPTSDTYIDKEVKINDEIERLRINATHSLMSRKDVIVVASVSCIYGLGSPVDYEKLSMCLRVGTQISREAILARLIDMQYERTSFDITSGKFRVRGDRLDICLPDKKMLRIELFGDVIDGLTFRDPISLTPIKQLDSYVLFPAKHFVVEPDRINEVVSQVQEELKERITLFREEDRLVEAQRLEQRTRYDMEMLKEFGYCSGIENYSLYLTKRKTGEPPYTLLDFFPKDFLLMVDESHATIPQVRGMYLGDRSRKENLVNYGFRLPSAFDNRPLVFDEFMNNINQVVFVSATPGDLELRLSQRLVEQIIRPTGLLDPEVMIRPVENQVEDLFGEISKVVERGERVLVTTLTKRMAEDLTEYYTALDLRVKYLHSEIATLERYEILKELQLGVFDCLIGVNLLREGLDLPQVSLVAILDADKEGFLRSERSLIQTIGRASRNRNGAVIMYADKVTKSMKLAIDVTNSRRKKQEEFNLKHGVTPTTITKTAPVLKAKDVKEAPEESDDLLLELKNQMLRHAERLEFEKAAEIRDRIKELEENILKAAE